MQDLDPAEAEDFCRVRTVAAGPISNVDRAAAHGIRQATAPVVALVEDHAYPEPGWASAIVRAHEGPWAAVGSAVTNANPATLLSWANLLIPYGRWSEPAERGETDMVSRHNVSFKRAVLMAYGDDLEHMLGREGGLLEDLRANGHRFYLEPQARYAHANPSRLASTFELRFSAGRLYGANRAAKGRWSLGRRLLYALGGPLIPLVRFRNIQRELFQAGRHGTLAPRVYPALLLALAFDGAGQVVGYLGGPGQTEHKLAMFEYDRLRHLTQRDRNRLLHAAPASA